MLLLGALVPTGHANHVGRTVDVLPGHAQGWSQSHHALGRGDDQYASTRTDGAVLSLSGWNPPQGAIHSVTLRIDQQQVPHNDDRFALRADGSDCQGLGFTQPRPEATGDRRVLSVEVLCQAGWTPARVQALRLHLMADAEGGFLLLSGVDGEWRVFGAWLSVTLVDRSPVVAAGPDQRVASSTRVTLDGRGSYDPDGSGLSYLWSQVSGPFVVIEGSTQPTATFVAPRPAQPTQLVFRLTVRDSAGHSASDDVVVTVEPPPSPSSPTTSPSPTPARTSPTSRAPTATGGTPTTPTTATSSPTATTPPLLPPDPPTTTPALPLPRPVVQPDPPGPFVMGCGARLPSSDLALTVPILFPPECGLDLVVIEGMQPGPGPIRFEAMHTGDRFPTTTPLDEGIHPLRSYEMRLVDGNDRPVPFERARIDFVVDAANASACPLDRCEVRLYHWEGDWWRPLNTTRIEANGTKASFRAWTSSFSPFVVGASPAPPATAPPGTARGALGPLLLLALAVLLVTTVVLGRQQRIRRLAAVTVQETADERMERLMKEIETNDELVQFVNNAAHDLANPLTPLKLHLSTLRHTAEALPPSQRRSLDVMQRNVDQLERLVSDLRDAARIRSGRMRVHLAPTDVAPLVRDAVDSFRPQAEEASVRLEATIEPGLRVPADAARLGQVLTNLIGNAIKFTPEGGRVHVTAAREGAGVRVSVTDTGIGIAPEDVQRLFQPFSQVHSEVQRKKGTGLGLFICKGIVEQHGGQIGCSSPGLGRGSTFWFSLPDEMPAPVEPASSR